MKKTNIYNIEPAQFRAARAYLNITQSELAKIANSHQVNIARFERGEVKPNATTMQKYIKPLLDRGIEFIDGGFICDK